MPSASIEDYTKAIYALEERHGVASTNALAERLGVSAPAVSSMVKKLAGLGYVEHVPYRGVRLTDEGRKVALEVSATTGCSRPTCTTSSGFRSTASTPRPRCSSTSSRRSSRS